MNDVISNKWLRFIAIIILFIISIWFTIVEGMNGRNFGCAIGFIGVFISVCFGVEMWKKAKYDKE